MIESSRELAAGFVAAVHEVFVKERVIHEKYSVEKYSSSDAKTTTTVSSGKGGEYESQIGFGWSNGVVLEFMHVLESGATSEEKE